MLMFSVQLTHALLMGSAMLWFPGEVQDLFSLVLLSVRCWVSSLILKISELGLPPTTGDEG